MLGALRGTCVAAGSLLEVFDDIAEALKSVRSRVHCANIAAPGGNDKEGGALEEQDLFRQDELAQITQMLLDLVKVWDEIMDDFSPSLVEGLVPDRSSKRDGNEVLGLASDLGDPLVVDIFALGGDDQIHLVDEYVDARGGRELTKGSDDRAVGEEIALEVSRLDVEDVNQDTNVGENMLALLREVVLHEGILSAWYQH